MTFKIRIADICVEVSSIYDRVYDFCQDYLDEKSIPMISISIEFNDLKQEAELNREEWPMSEERAAYMEMLALYRKIAEAFLTRNIFLMHGAVLSAGGAGVMFTAPSGTGKTTHCRLWMKHIRGCHMVNGDKPLVQVGTDGVMAYGTPWYGKEHMGCNEQVPLRAVCYVKRSEENRLTRVSSSAVWTLLLKQVYFPKDAQGIQQTIALFNQFCAKVPVYLLECNMEPEAAYCAYQALQADGVISL